MSENPYQSPLTAGAPSKVSGHLVFMAVLMFFSGCFLAKTAYTCWNGWLQSLPSFPPWLFVLQSLGAACWLVASLSYACRAYKESQ